MAERETAREAVLGRVRSALARSGSSTSGPGAWLRPSTSAQRLEPGQRLSSFVQRLESAGGRAYVAADEAAAASHLAAIARDCDARSIALSDSALARRVAAAAGLSASTFDGWSDRERLFAADLGLSGVQAGIAETGTLVLDSRAERHRLVSLVPPVHVAVLRAEAIADDLGSALAGLGRAEELASAVTLITGPSRTADIELELVIGVHGPRELHVLVLETANP